MKNVLLIEPLSGCIHHGVSELGLSWPEGMRFWEE